MNLYGILAIYRFEMARMRRTILTSIASPVLSTSLYFIVFGSAIGSRMNEIEGVAYGSYIVPGLVLLSVLTESISNAAFGIYMPKFSGMIYEVLSSPLSAVETVIGYVGAAASKSLLLGLIILLTARFFVPYTVLHPFTMLFILSLVCVTFCLFGFILGLLANGFERLQIVPALIVAPLTFLGGSFYSIHMLPPLWQKLTLLNPIVYLINAFRWSFYGVSDVNLAFSFAMIAAFMLACLAAIVVIFRTGYQIRN